jgi:hypothetical protein
VGILKINLTPASGSTSDKRLVWNSSDKIVKIITETAGGTTAYSGLTGLPNLGLYETVSNFNGYSGTTVPNTYETKSAINTYTGTTVPNLLNSKLNTSIYQTYTGTTVPNLLNSKLNTSIYQTYTGTTIPSLLYLSNVSLTGNTTLNASHDGKIIECNGTFTVTFPNNLSNGFAVIISNVGTGTITLAANGTLQGLGTKITEQYTGAMVYNRGSNVWLAIGNLTT